MNKKLAGTYIIFAILAIGYIMYSVAKSSDDWPLLVVIACLIGVILAPAWIVFKNLLH